MPINPSGKVLDGLDSIASGTSSSEFIEAFNNNFAKLMNAIYPVGSIYITVSPTNPADIFGGTWQRIKDRFLLAAGDTYSTGTTGGAATHTLTEGQLPVIEGEIANYAVQDDGGVSGNGVFSTIRATGTWVSFGTNSQIIPEGSNTTDILKLKFGSNQPHNNMPPYLVVNVWQRIPDPEPAEE